MITPENVARHELIGLDAEIVDSTNKSQIGIKGKIIDETMNTIKIEVGSDEKEIAKKDVTIIIKLPTNERVEIEGKILVSRPEDRIKKKFKKW